jgi:hypothetical protein
MKDVLWVLFWIIFGGLIGGSYIGNYITENNIILITYRAAILDCEKSLPRDQECGWNIVAIPKAIKSSDKVEDRR